MIKSELTDEPTRTSPMKVLSLTGLAFEGFIYFKSNLLISIFAQTFRKPFLKILINCANILEYAAITNEIQAINNTRL